MEFPAACLAYMSNERGVTRLKMFRGANATVGGAPSDLRYLQSIGATEKGDSPICFTVCKYVGLFALRCKAP